VVPTAVNSGVERVELRGKCPPPHGHLPPPHAPAGTTRLPLSSIAGSRSPAVLIISATPGTLYESTFDESGARMLRRPVVQHLASLSPRISSFALSRWPWKNIVAFLVRRRNHHAPDRIAHRTHWGIRRTITLFKANRRAIVSNQINISFACATPTGSLRLPGRIHSSPAHAAKTVGPRPARRARG
jgi:hypothetical protein